MDAGSMDLYPPGCRIKILIFQFSDRSAVHGVGHICSKAIYIKAVSAPSNLFIRGKGHMDLSMLAAFLGGGQEVFDISLAGNTDKFLTAFLMLACFGATLSAPSLLDRYTFIGGGGAGNMVLGMAMRSGFGSFGRMGGSIGRVAGNATGNAPIH